MLKNIPFLVGHLIQPTSLGCRKGAMEVQSTKRSREGQEEVA
jgi:hypothetical protein